MLTPQHTYREQLTFVANTIAKHTRQNQLINAEIAKQQCTKESPQLICEKSNFTQKMFIGIHRANFFSNSEQSYLFKLICSYSQTNECRNLFQIPLIINSDENIWITYRKMCVCVSGVKKCSFFGKFSVLCFLITSVLRLSLLPYCRRIEVLLISDHAEADTKLIFHTGMSNEAKVVAAKDTEVFLILIHALGQLEPLQQETADWVTFTEEILIGKLLF